jgi:L-ascorbate metabolism protein UlaG (beta-lactamase superfamily)
MVIVFREKMRKSPVIMLGVLLFHLNCYAEQAKICHISSSGFYVSDGESAVLLDALYADGMDGDPFASDELNGQMENALGHFSKVKLVYSSHIHEDHMKAKPILRHLRNNQNAKAILPAQADILMKAAGVGDENARIDFVSIIKGEKRVLKKYPFPVTLYGLNHGTGNEHIESLGIKFTLAGKTFMHVGDMYGEQLITEKIEVDYLMLPFWYLTRPERVEYITTIIEAEHIIPMHFSLDSSQWMQSMGGLDKVKSLTYAAADNLLMLDQEMMCINFE